MMDPKQRAAQAAVEMLSDDMVVGLGTGSTAEYFLQGLSEAIRGGRLRGIRGIPTSARSEQRARELGIQLTNFTRDPVIDVTVDGADEIDPNLDLIKGLGGALLREKIVAQNSRKMVVIADAGKLVQVLGMKSPLPVEVAKFEHQVHAPFLRTLGCEPSLRRREDGTDYITDNGNLIYDCRFTRIADVQKLNRALSDRAGIVESGLFIGIANVALVADPTGVRTITRDSATRHTA